MEGKLNISGRVSIPIIKYSDDIFDVDWINNLDYPDIEVVFALDCNIDDDISWFSTTCNRPYRVIRTTGPSIYTPNGWQLPLILAIGESTGNHVFLSNPLDNPPRDIITNMMNSIGDAPVSILYDGDYNEYLSNIITNDCDSDISNTPILFRKDPFYRMQAYHVGQIRYYRYMQLSIWCDGGYVSIPPTYTPSPIEVIDLEDNIKMMVECGYDERDLQHGGKYRYDLTDYEMRELAQDLYRKCSIDRDTIPSIVRGINYA